MRPCRATACICRGVGRHVYGCWTHYLWGLTHFRDAGSMARDDGGMPWGADGKTRGAEQEACVGGDGGMCQGAGGI